MTDSPLADMTHLPHALRRVFSPPRIVVDLAPVVIIWLALALVFTLRAWNTDFLALFGDTDDATRLTVVRDLMAGQNWFDHVQHRLNTPFGAEIPWSRLIDLPLALIIGVFNILAPGQGERIALFVWPLLLLLPALYLTGALTRRLVGPDHVLTALVVAAMALPVFSEFSPGRIDHHNVEAVLVLWLALESLNALTRNGAAWRAGIAAATSLAIGAETLPIVGAAISAFGLIWVIDTGFAPRLWRFGAGFAAATLVHFLIATGPSDWFAAHCDALSIVHLAAAIGVGIVFFVLARLPSPDDAYARRLGLGIAGAAGLTAILLEVFPGCAARPFAGLDPWLTTAWLGKIVEARPLWESLFSLPSYAISAAMPVLAALGAVVFRLIRADAAMRRDWLIYGVLLLAATLGMMLQLRGVRLAALLAVPGAVALIVMMHERYMAAAGRAKPAAALGLIAAWLVSGGIAVYITASLAFPSGKTDIGVSALSQCLGTDSFAPLARLSPARIAAPVDLGSYLLLMTPHTVIGAPYHRNVAGIADSYRVFGAGEAAAWRVLDRRGIDLVVSCDAMLAQTGGGLDAPDSLKSLFAVGGQPDWLTPLPVPAGGLRIYRVAR